MKSVVTGDNAGVPRLPGSMINVGDVARPPAPGASPLEAILEMANADNTMAERAKALWSLGLHVFPLGSPNDELTPDIVRRFGSEQEARCQWPKTPRISWGEYQIRQPTEGEIQNWWTRWPDANIAIVTGIQFDVIDADSGEAVDWCRSGVITRTPWESHTGRGVQFLYRKTDLEVRNHSNGAGNIDVRGEGGYIVGPGSTHTNGTVYQLVADESYRVTIFNDLPALTAEDLVAVKRFKNDLGYSSSACDYNIRSPVQPVPVGVGERNDTLSRLLGRWFGRERATFEQALANARDWNRSNDQPLSDSEVFRTVESIRRTHNIRNPERRVVVEAECELDPDSWPPPRRFERSGKECTDVANAHRFFERNARDLLHIDGIGWHCWDGSRWVHDEHYADRCAQKVSLAILEEAARYSRESFEAKAKGHDDESVTLGNKANELSKWARTSEQSLKVAATKNLAKAYMSYGADQFDADPMLLNCSNGTLDLKNGEFRLARRQDLCTKTTGVDYDPNAPYDLWDSTVLDICCGDHELLGYLKRAMGYCLTGLINEQVMLIFNGGGANGKDTFLGRVKKAMGDYSGLTAPGLLMESRSDRHPTEIADLRGVRLAIASESSDNHRLHETRVKQLTGTEAQKARMMRQDFFEFPTQFKLVLMTNHRPVVEGDDMAIWRRLQLVPFNQTFRKGVNRDDSLPARLDQSVTGILRWCVDGCIEWQRDGLRPPEAVSQATDQYKSEQDVLAQYLDEHCVIKSTEQIMGAALFRDYDRWCASNGVSRQSSRWLNGKLYERGIKKKKLKGGILLLGIGLTQRADTTSYQ